MTRQRRAFDIVSIYHAYIIHKKVEFNEKIVDSRRHFLHIYTSQK